jgi:hydroxyacylglutathione hydrolase
MQVIQIYMKNSLRNFNYIIYSEKSKEAIFIDPLNIDFTLPFGKNLNLEPKYLVNTHYHPDHMNDNNKFLELNGTKEIIFNDGDKLELAEGDYIQALKTPGHVDDHICFIVYSNHKAIGIISGDALFNAGVGHCKLGGNVEEHFESTTFKIKTLDDSLLVYPSHDYLLTNLNFALTVEPNNVDVIKLRDKRLTQDLDNEFIQTNIEMEKKINPFLRLDSEELKQRFTGESSKDIFISLRKLRDNF